MMIKEVSSKTTKIVIETSTEEASTMIQQGITS